jgi:hypothetical protein
MAERVEIDIIARTEKAVAGLESLIKKLAVTYLSYQALKTIVVDSVKAYAQAQQAEIRLGAAIKITGQERTASLRGLVAYAEALQTTTNYEHEATEAGMGVLMQIGRLTEQGVKKAIPVIQDFASLWGMDLVSASELFSKSMAGTTNMLGRYGIDLKDLKDPQERFNAIMEQAQKQAGGFAVEVAKSTSGQLKQFKLQVDELKESFGGLIAVGLNPAVGYLNTIIDSIINGRKEWQLFDIALRNSAAQGNIDDLKKQIAALEDYKNLYATPAIQDVKGGLFAKAWKTLWYEISGRGLKDILKGTVGEVDKQIAVLQQALADAEKGLIGPPKPDILPGVSGAVEIDKMTIALDDQARAWVALGRAAWAADIPAEISNMANRWTALGEAYTEVTPKVEKLAEAYKNMNQYLVYTASYDSLIKTSDAVEDLKDQYRDLAIQVGQDAFVSFFDAIGKAAAGTDDFAEAMKNLVAQVAASIGKLMVQAGLEIIIANAYNPAMIALGIALMVAGGVTISAGSYIGAQDTGGKGVPAMAEGGIVTRPTLALLGEKGPEAVVPLGQGVGGVNITNHIYGSIWQTDDLARAVAGRQARW